MMQYLLLFVTGLRAAAAQSTFTVFATPATSSSVAGSASGSAPAPSPSDDNSGISTTTGICGPGFTYCGYILRDHQGAQFLFIYVPYQPIMILFRRLPLLSLFPLYHIPSPIVRKTPRVRCFLFTNSTFAFKAITKMISSKPTARPIVPTAPVGRRERIPSRHCTSVCRATRRLRTREAPTTNWCTTYWVAASRPAPARPRLRPLLLASVLPAQLLPQVTGSSCSARAAASVLIPRRTI